MPPRLKPEQFTEIEADYDYEIIRLNEDVLLNGASLERGTLCALHGDADLHVRLAQIREDQFVQNVPCRAAQNVSFFGFEPGIGDFNISFHLSGLLEHAVLAQDYKINDVLLPAGTILWLEDTSQEWTAYLPEDRIINGVPCKARPDWYLYGEAIGAIGVEFAASQRIAGVELSAPHRIGFCEFPSETYLAFYPDGSVKAARFAGALEFDGVQWQGGKGNPRDNDFDLYFHANGRVEAGRLARAVVIQSVRCAEGELVRFSSSGVLLPSPRDEMQDAETIRGARTPLVRHRFPLLSRRRELLQAIATTTADYREGEIPPMTPEHVERWVSQFPDDGQLELLEATSSWLGRSYVARSGMVTFLDNLVTEEWLVEQHPKSTLLKTSFLNLQQRSTSQRDLLSMIDTALHAHYGLRSAECGTTPERFIYLDDCLYTGNRARDDLRPWAQSAPEAAQLTLVFFACHTQGAEYLTGQLEPILRSRRITLSIRAGVWLRNRPEDNDRFDCFWPRDVSGVAEIDRYVSVLRQQAQRWGVTPRLFRPAGVPVNDTLCSTPADRDRLEREFLQTGAHIVSLPQNPRPTMRPLGFDKLHSLGFGASLVMYRNISNNCPLALWWGAPDAPAWHPLSKWYPLFPRRENRDTDIGLREPLGWWRSGDDE